MRHEEIRNRDSFDIVEISTHEGPASAALAELEQGSSRQPESAAPDVPASVGVMLAAVYGAIVALFAMTIATAGQAPFMIAVDIIFLAAFFAVPAIMLKQERGEGGRPSMSRFLSRGMQTYTGHVSGGGALAQMFVVPVLLAFAVLAIGVIASLA
jgi:hypothetical protein